ncbi:MAG: hypothetical protein R2690_07940 [Acidimicrobiales bacterium]
MADDATNEAVVTTRQLVNEYLAGAFDEVEVADGVWTIRYGSAKVDITVDVFDGDFLGGAPCHPPSRVRPSPELHVHRHRRAQWARVRAPRGDRAGDTITITFGHSLLRRLPRRRRERARRSSPWPSPPMSSTTSWRPASAARCTTAPATTADTVSATAVTLAA